MIIRNYMRTIAAFDKVETLLVKSDSLAGERCIENTIYEHFIKIYINDKFWIRTACTPNELVELIVGRLISEGIIDISASDTLEDCIKSIEIYETGKRADVWLNDDIKIEEKFFLHTKLAEFDLEDECFMEQLSQIVKKPICSFKINPEWIFELSAAFSKDSQLHKATKGTHSCYLSNMSTIHSFEDIGRHNAIDKAIGYAALNAYDLSACILFTTGRVSVDMMLKAIISRISVLVSKAVPTTAAIKLAKRYNITLISRAWQDSYEIYCE